MSTTSLIPSVFRRRKSPAINAPTIFSLLAIFPARSRLLQLLSAYDCAKLDKALGGILSAVERRTYIDCTRDLFWHHSDMHRLMRHGMKLLVLGKDVAALRSRLRWPKYGASSKKRLRIFLAGLFPLHGQPIEFLLDALGVSVEPYPDTCRIKADKDDLEKLRIRSEIDILPMSRYFLLSFAVPKGSDPGDTCSAWYKVPRAPEASVDLYTYIPSTRDRLYATVTVPLMTIARMSRGTCRSWTFFPILAALKAYFGNLHGRDLGYQRDFWRGADDGLAPAMGSILLEFTPFSTYTEIIY